VLWAWIAVYSSPPRKVVRPGPPNQSAILKRSSPENPRPQFDSAPKLRCGRVPRVRREVQYRAAAADTTKPDRLPISATRRRLCALPSGLGSGRLALEGPGLVGGPDQEHGLACFLQEVDDSVVALCSPISGFPVENQFERHAPHASSLSMII
jgi:hypothetical protein